MASPACNKLFVYGTLRRGMPNKFARFLSRNSAFLGSAHVHGRLYQRPGYPGLKLAPAGRRVTGEVFRLRRPEAILRVLDRYEGHEFRRVETAAVMRNGRGLSVWIYAYVPPRRRPTPPA
jgi:gamma-glutamylcyclotransferase (GGCT)/AIG2-like uncharacterized protein YtfP